MKRDYFRTGLAVSCLAHLILAYCTWSLLTSSLGELPEAIVYSISLEGSGVLGGVTQVPEKEDAKVVPLKNVTEEQRPDPVKEILKSEEDKKEPLPEEPDAEVSVSTPIPRPTLQPTQAPTIVPTRQATTAPTPKATSRPAATAAPKATAPAKRTAKPISEAEAIDKQYQKSMQKYLGESSDAGGKGYGSGPSRGTSGKGGGVVKPREFFEYAQTVQRLIKNAWNWYDSQTLLVTVVRINIGADGGVGGVAVVKSSGNGQFDDSVVRAVRKVDRFPPPPAIVAEDFREVDVTFNPRDLL